MVLTYTSALRFSCSEGRDAAGVAVVVGLGPEAGRRLEDGREVPRPAAAADDLLLAVRRSGRVDERAGRVGGQPVGDVFLDVPSHVEAAKG